MPNVYMPPSKRIGLNLTSASSFTGIPSEEFLDLFYKGELPRPVRLGNEYIWRRVALVPHVRNRPQVYFVGYDKVVKIGFTENPSRRFAGLQTSCPYPLAAYVVYDAPRDEERRLHREFAEDRLSGEWIPLPRSSAHQGG